MSNAAVLHQKVTHKTNAPVAFPTDKMLRAPARAGGMRRRHWVVILSFVLLVCAPAAGVATYLYTRAADQYASHLGFSVRTEHAPMPAPVLGGLTPLSGTGAPDADILFAYLGSQDLVRKLDDMVDLRAIWSRVPHARDPVFALDPAGTIEDVMAHWGRMVDLVYDPSTGLIDVHVRAFSPQDAQTIAQAVLSAGEDMINVLSTQAREDAIGYARRETEEAAARLKQARLTLTAFRNRTQIVDPALDTRNRMGLLITLQEQLADALIDLDLLAGTTGDTDPRVLRAKRRAAVIRARIEAERRTLGAGQSDRDEPAFAALIGEFESLTADRAFAESAYLSALAAYDGARAEARKQSRYLAAHIRPTLAERADHPAHLRLLALTVAALLSVWAVLCLVGYGLSDRR